MSAFSNLAEFANPGDFCCTIYPEQNFKGESFTYCLQDQDEDVRVFKIGGGLNDTMSSWDCGKKVIYNFCKHYDFFDYNCTRDRGESGAGRARNPTAGRNDEMSMLRLQRYNVMEKGAVTTFTGKDCTGISARFYVDDEDVYGL